jgi:hypothetical protein
MIYSTPQVPYESALVQPFWAVRLTRPYLYLVDTIHWAQPLRRFPKSGITATFRRAQKRANKSARTAIVV